MTAISIIMPCHNRAYDLAGVLVTYDRQEFQEPFEIIAIDDASTDHTYDVLTSYRPTHYRLHPIRLESNKGPATARNLGIELAEAPLLIFVGDDIVPDRNFLQGHLNGHQQYSGPGEAILGKIIWPPDLPVNTLMQHIDGIGAEQFSYHYLVDGQEYDFRHFYTSNISIKRELLDKVESWFDTGFHYAAFEDVELAYRLEQKGLKIVYDAGILAYHYHYHNIWTFSTRQYHSGLMACLLVKKHPELSGLIKGNHWLLKNVLRATAGFPRILSQKHIAELEQAILHHLSGFEWRSHEMLDSWYLQALNYFYQKGVLLGTFGNSLLANSAQAARVRRLHSAIEVQ